MNLPQYKNFRQKHNYYLALGSELASPLLHRYALRKTGGTRAIRPPKEWRKLLLAGTDHIGDLLYLSCSLEALKRGLPQCEIHFIASRPGCEVLTNNPNVQKIHSFEAPLGVYDERFHALQAEGYDAAAIYDTGSYWRFQKMAVDLGIPNRAGYNNKGFSAWVTHPIRILKRQSFPGYFRDYVAQLTGQVIDGPLRPRVYPSTEDVNTAESLFQEFQLDKNKPVVACFVTTRQPTPVWSEGNYLETLRLAHAATPIQVIFCGAKSDQEKLESLCSKLGMPSHINAGRLELKAMISFLSNCQAVLCTDSGSRHMSNAAGVPVVFLRNLLFDKVAAGVYSDSEYDMAPDAEFIPAELQPGYLAQVFPQTVADRLVKILQKR